MLITEVDIFTIVMSKAIEYYTKAFPNIKHHNEPITLAEALHEMKDFTNLVTESARPEQSSLPKSYAYKAEQLSLFIKESRGKYEVIPRQGK
jgi:hypothetical protein